MASRAARSTEEQTRVLTVVRAAQELLAMPQRWTRGAIARDARGHGLMPDDDRAVRWCLTGALLKEGARIDGRRIRLRPTATPDDLGITDVYATASGRLAVETVGLVLADLLAVEGAGVVHRRRFVFDPHWSMMGEASAELLPEIFNDRRQTHHRDVESKLWMIEAFLDARVAGEARRRQRKGKRRDGAA